jgi:hypothetical protein
LPHPTEKLTHRKGTKYDEELSLDGW